MSCRHQDHRDHTTPMVITGQHADPPPDDHPEKCRGCLPCPKRHCTVCNTHLLAGEEQACIDCQAQVRRDLNAALDYAALLPDHALDAARDGHLTAADPIPGGEALVMMSRGSEGLTELDPENLLPPSYVLGWWEAHLRDHLDLDSIRPAWQRRPAATLLGAHRFLNDHLTWAAIHHPGFHALAHDLAQLRIRLEELLRAGDAPALGVPCFTCGTRLERDYRRPKPCACGPRPRPPHAAHHRDDVCCLGCAIELRWELAHHTCDQGGLNVTEVDSAYTGWHCPKCKRRYRPGEYQLAVRSTHDKVAQYRRLDDAARLTGAKPGTIKMWASRRHVRKGRDDSGRVTYNLGDIRARLAEQEQPTADSSNR